MEKLKRISVFLLLSLLLVAVSNCKKDDNNDDEKNISSLKEKIWMLQEVENAQTHVITPFPDIPQKITLEFGEMKKAIITGVCNTGSASYAVSGNQLTFTNVIITQILCDNSDWEDYTIESLKDASTFEFKDGKLIITSKGTYNLIFIAK